MNVISISFFNSFYALEIVKRCISEQIPVKAIIFIGSEVPELEKKILAERTPSIKGPLISDEVFLGKPVFFLNNLNSESSVTFLKSVKPDLIIQGGGPIYKESVLSIPRLGVINCHPGILPKYRGSSCVEWAIYNDDPVGATCHYLDVGIDSGPIIKKKELQIMKTDTYQDIRTKMFYHQSELMIEGIKTAIGGLTKDQAEIQSDGTVWKTPGEDVINKVKKIIAEKTYSHFS